MKKISFVFGTRPEAIKLCPLINELKSRKILQTEIIVSGQHREMLDGVLDGFGVVPDVNMNLMREGQSLSDITERVLCEASRLFKDSPPSLVLVHGDTTTAFAAALAAFYQKIPIGHVEAGLRTYNLKEPFPEEFNRRLIDTVATLHFAPTESAKENLLREGFEEKNIFVTGNTGIDALKSTVKENFSHPLTDIAKKKRVLLLTAHRRENIGEPLYNIYSAVRRIAEKYRELCVICPVHKNPAVSKIAYLELGNTENIILCEPLELSVFHNLMARSYVILTDSGGIQEEAAALGVPTLVLRNVTERPEGVRAGVLRAVGCDADTVYNEFVSLYEDSERYLKTARSSEVFGTGKASEKIADILEKIL